VTRLKISLSIFVVLVVTLGIVLSNNEAVRDWWRRGLPPHPYIYPATFAGSQLAGTDTDHQFSHTFYYGEECGRLLTLEDAAKRGQAVPEELRTHFFDGVGHGFAAPSDDINATVTAIEKHIPAEYTVSVHDGVLRHHTMEEKGDPTAVVQFAQKYTRLSGLPDPYNGVRIGLQRALGKNLSDALSTAKRYPKDYWPALFEELGWRSSGHRPDRLPDAPADILEDDAYWSEATKWVRRNADVVPESSLCHYFHGAIRGRGLRYPWQNSRGWVRIQDEIDGFDKKCRSESYQGIAWAVFIHAAHKPKLVNAMLSSITDKNGQGVAKKSYAHIVASLKSTKSDPLAPWEIERMATLIAAEMAQEKTEEEQ